MVVFIVSFQIVFVVANLLQTTHIPSHEYESAIIVLFLPMAIALGNIFLLNSNQNLNPERKGKLWQLKTEQ